MKDRINRLFTIRYSKKIVKELIKFKTVREKVSYIEIALYIYLQKFEMGDCMLQPMLANDCSNWFTFESRCKIARLKETLHFKHVAFCIRKNWKQ